MKRRYLALSILGLALPAHTQISYAPSVVAPDYLFLANRLTQPLVTHAQPFKTTATRAFSTPLDEQYHHDHYHQHDHANKFTAAESATKTTTPSGLFKDTSQQSMTPVNTPQASLLLRPDSEILDQGQPFVLSSLGSGVGFIDRQNEMLIGEKVYREVQQQLPVLQDLWLSQQLNAVFSQILAPSQVQQPIGLLLVKDSQINAFAVPGGLFALNTGIITTAKSMHEVAGVVAHEIAHVSQRHYSRSQEAFKGQGLLSLAGLVVGAAIAAKASPDAGSLVMLGSQAALLDRQLNYSRNQEREADRIGMQYMAAAGYNPVAMADFFERMHRASIQLSLLPDFWLSHPLTTERMSEARLRAAQYQKVQQPASDPQFELIKTYTAMLSGVTSEEKLKIASRQGNMAAKLTLAAWYAERANFELAQQLINDIEPNYNSDHLLALIQTDIYLAQKKPDQALKFLKPIQQVTPENRALNFKLAEVYTALGQANVAIKLLQPFAAVNERDVELWRLMQQAMQIKKDDPFQTIQVLRYRAEQQFWSGREEAAIKSLLHAQRLAQDHPVFSTLLKTRLEQMQQQRQLKI